MLLEIVSGRRNSEKIKEGMFTYFPTYAAVKVSEGDVMCLLDSRLEGDADEEQLKRACRVPCWCIQDAEDHRPMMGQVVHILDWRVSWASMSHLFPGHCKTMWEWRIQQMWTVSESLFLVQCEPFYLFIFLFLSSVTHMMCIYTTYSRKQCLHSIFI